MAACPQIPPLQTSLLPARPQTPPRSVQFPLARPLVCLVSFVKAFVTLTARFLQLVCHSEILSHESLWMVLSKGGELSADLLT